MKKTFAVIAAVLFVLSFAASAFAIHAEIPAETQAVVAKGGTQITIGGEIRVRGWLTKNRGDVVGGIWDSDKNDGQGGWEVDKTESYVVGICEWGRWEIPCVQEVYTYTERKKTIGQKFATNARTASWYDQRVRLYVDAQVAPNVRGYVMLESESSGRSQWDSLSDKWAWGNFNSHPSGIAIAEAWILYNGSGLFGFNSGLKIGHMPLKLGEGQFFEHTQLGDDAIVFFMDPTKQIHIGLLAVKFGGDGQGNAYSPILPFGQGNFMNSAPSNTTGGYATGAGSTANNRDDLDGYVALMTYKIDDKNTIGINYTYLNKSDIGFKLQNLGVHGNGSFGNFGYAAEVDFQFGKVFDSSLVYTVNEDKSHTHADTLDYDGWAIMLKGNYKMNNWNFRGSFGYGSGDDFDDDHDLSTFIPFVGSVQNYTLIYDYLATTTAGGTGTGLANTTYYNLGVDYAATKDLSFSLDGYILRASDTWKGADISKDAGYEIDAKMKYVIAKNLVYQIDLGYFKAGDFYSDTMKAITDMTYSHNPHWNESIKVSDDKGMTVLRNMITLSF